jgi:preprotein translocase subunit SecG
MLTKILLTLLILDSLLLMAAILLQAGKGGGLAASFGGVTSSADAILGTRQAGNLLTKLSWWCGGLFLFLAFVLSLASANRTAPRSILDQTFSQPAPTSTTPPAQPNTSVLPIQPVTPTGAAQTQPSAPTKTKSP